MRIFLSIVTACFMWLPVYGFAAQSDDGGGAPLPLVGVAEVGLEAANPPEKYIGHVESMAAIDLRARVEGYLERLDFKEGSFVQKGRVLYVIEQAPYKARVAVARAKVVQAEADLFKAETRLERLRSARPESVPKTDLDDAVAARDLARGRLDEAKANLELAEIDLGYTTVEAPITGRIGRSLYKPGDLVGPSSQPLAEIVLMDPIRVVFSVSERQGEIIMHAMEDAEKGDGAPFLTVGLEFPGGRAYSRKGKIDFVDNRVDPDTGTIAIWGRFENPDGHLVPGEYVRVFLGEAKPEMVPAVAQAAVQRDQEGAFVYVVDAMNKVQQRRITTGPVLDGKFTVTSGLKPGEKVIVQGIQKVRPGITVNIEGE
jgi:membrane fusion protein (multidrug efflux system)